MTGPNDCVLYDRPCVECGECDRCDIDPNKVCDNCMKCVSHVKSGEGAACDYRAIRIDGLLLPDETLEGEES